MFMSRVLRFLGSSAALFGGWLERAGPRKAGVLSACLLVRRPADLGARRLASTSSGCSGSAPA